MTFIEQVEKGTIQFFIISLIMIIGGIFTIIMIGKILA